jgi:hypothetical protein
MFGRADASMTLNAYADLWPDRLDEVVEAVSKRRALALDSENHVHDPKGPIWSELKQPLIGE